MPRRNRSANFSSNEMRILMRLIEEYKPIFNRKTNDNDTIQMKASDWTQIANTFNRLSTTSIVRDAEQLKQKFSNMRKMENRRKREQLTQAKDATCEVKIELDDKSPGNSMDSTNFGGSESADSSHATQRMNIARKSTAPTLNRPFGHLRECGRPGTSNGINQNDAVSGKWLFWICFRDAIDTNFYSQNSNALNLDKVDKEIDRLLNAEDINDNHLDFDCDSNLSDVIPAKKASHSEQQNRNEESDMEALQRTLIKRKIVLCNLQIDIARRQLQAFDKPLSATET